MRWGADRPMVLAYGAAGTETEPRERPEPGDELCALLGRTRARVLGRLPESTSELSGDLEFAASTISEHLGELEAMGLVTRGRSGPYMIYQRTERAQRLLALY